MLTYLSCMRGDMLHQVCAVLNNQAVMAYKTEAFFYSFCWKHSISTTQLLQKQFPKTNRSVILGPLLYMFLT